MLYFNIQRTKKYNYLTLPTLQKCDLYQKNVFLTRLKSFSALKYICKIFGKSRHISDFAFPDFLEILYMKIFGKSGIIHILRLLGFQILSIDWPNFGKSCYILYFAFARLLIFIHVFYIFGQKWQKVLDIIFCVSQVPLRIDVLAKRWQISYFALARHLYHLCNWYFRQKNGISCRISYFAFARFLYLIDLFGKN